MLLESLSPSYRAQMMVLVAKRAHAVDNVSEHAVLLRIVNYDFSFSLFQTNNKYTFIKFINNIFILFETFQNE